MTKQKILIAIVALIIALLLAIYVKTQNQKTENQQDYQPRPAQAIEKSKQ